MAKLRQAEMKKDQLIVYNGENSEQWTVKSNTEINVSFTIPCGCNWLIPLKWNQGGYDFVQFDQGNFLRVPIGSMFCFVMDRNSPLKLFGGV